MIDFIKNFDIFQLDRWWYTLRKKPYFRLVCKTPYVNDGAVIDLVWNTYFINDLLSHRFESDSDDEVELVMQWLGAFLRNNEYTDEYQDKIQELLDEISDMKGFLDAQGE